MPGFKAYIEEHIQVPHSYAPIHLSQQRAGALGALALQYYHEGRYESAADHQPDYLRLSQAEREALAAEKRAGKGMIIRKMELRDLPQVVMIEESLFSDPWTEDAFYRDTLDQKEADFVVAVSVSRKRLLATVGLSEHWMKRKLSMLPSGKKIRIRESELEWFGH